MWERDETHDGAIDFEREFNSDVRRRRVNTRDSVVFADHRGCVRTVTGFRFFISRVKDNRNYT